MFVLAGLGAGGAERVVSLLSGELVRRGYRMLVVSFDAADENIYHGFDPQVEIVRLGIPAGGGSFVRGAKANWRRVAALRQMLKQHRPDAVLSFLTKINVLSVAASAGLNIPVIISERNNPAVQRAHPFWASAWKIAASRASAIVLQTDAIKALYPDSIRKRAVIIPNPVVAPANDPTTHHAMMVTAVGRLEWQKGFDLLIKAFASVAPDNPKWKLTIWGEGAERARLELLAKESGHADRIDLPGNSQGQAGWMKNADIFVLSSRYEGFPNVLLEAMSAGIPCISFRCDYGPEEMIDDGVNGWLVEPENFEELAQKLTKLMKNEEFRNRLGSAARERTKQYGISPIVSKWEAVVKKEIYTQGK